jgi:hypothetical protein
MNKFMLFCLINFLFSINSFKCADDQLQQYDNVFDQMNLTGGIGNDMSQFSKQMFRSSLFLVFFFIIL